MTDEEALRQFGGSDEIAARGAFDHLFKHYLSFAKGVLGRKFSYCNAADVENAVQQTFLNLWQSRRQVAISDLPAWRGLLSKTIRNCYIDVLRARKPTLSLDELDRVPPDERAYALEIVDNLAMAATIRRLVYAANACWLGLSLTKPIEEHNRRLLAAQLFYLEGADMEEILDLFRRAHPGTHPLSRTTLADWLDDPGTLLHLAYTALYYSPAALTIHLLGLEEETPAEVLDTLLTRQSADDVTLPLNIDWTSQEVHALLWRYYRNVTPQHEQSIPQSDLNLEELFYIFDRCRVLFPFSKQMEDLLNGTQGALEALCGPSRPGLWRRLAFQYRYLDELTHQDIEERIAPAAQQVAFPISQTVLQGWISSRRLLTALAQTCADLLEEYKNE